VNARRWSSFSAYPKIDAGTTTLTTPRRNLRQFKLRKKVRGFGAAVFEHPPHQSLFPVSELAIVVAHRKSSGIP
jgi:hypothetical protein